MTRAAVPGKSARERARSLVQAAPGGSRAGTPRLEYPHGDDRAGNPAPVAAERHPEDAGERPNAAPVQARMPGEVAEAVGDQAPAAELHPAQDVRPVARDQVGPRVHHRVRERDHVAAVLAEEVLVAAVDVRGVRALGSRVHRHDDQVGAGNGVAHALGGGRDVEEVPAGDAGREPRTAIGIPCARK